MVITIKSCCLFPFFFNLLIVSISENKVKKKIFTILMLCIGPIIIHNLIYYASFKKKIKILIKWKFR